MLVDLKMKGRLNLANLKKAYPVDIDQDLSGILDADITTNFDMNTIEREAYENVKAQGSMKLSKFDYESPDLAELIHIETATVNFTTNAIQLNSFEMTAGSTDLQLNGDLSNLMGFVFSDKPLQGIFNATSTNFNISDFMVDSEVGDKTSDSENSTTETANTKSDDSVEAIKIRDFLDIVLNFNAKTVIYDNLTLKNAKGSLALKKRKCHP